MINNILSYFTKDITDLHELAKYTISKNSKNSKNIYIYYDKLVLWIYGNDKDIIYNNVLSIYKESVYNENKCNRYFSNNKISYVCSRFSLIENNSIIITYSFKIHSYLAKYYLIYRYLTSWQFKFTIVYFNGYIYKYRNHFVYKKPYSNRLIYKANKYELIFYSNLFCIFFVYNKLLKSDYKKAVYNENKCNRYFSNNKNII